MELEVRKKKKHDPNTEKTEAEIRWRDTRGTSSSEVAKPGRIIEPGKLFRLLLGEPFTAASGSVTRADC